MTTRQTPAPPSPDDPSARLVEELLQIARLSALEEMASGFAHELNQPIGAITTFAQAGQRMLDRPQPMVQPALEVLRHVSNEALKAGEGIHRIRKLFGPTHTARAESVVADVVNELLPVLQLLAKRYATIVSVEVAQSIPVVTIDPRRIQHVLYTLVQNALEAQGDTADRQVRIELCGDRYSATVSVIDRGSGIPDDVRNHLFRPFFTTKPNGTGLGLASSRAIVEEHDGTIGFDNIAGGGTRFWFRLPATAGAS
ncbi:C4-dicarboxylate-specific signal transduction histidine kinase [Povalibacter uvarum]|uniref:histidine kinase n=1 Tax=Povalibacter uvarum TaxID=732238 RepID=A0A841HIS6_9GAMM|nr:ATP-binding protein [Povalibacter uvarum]MBB6092128.1 C4-dicarboxylate-specific signal transduction histidine kinase [Povalibacter uvarum]